VFVTVSLKDFATEKVIVFGFETSVDAAVKT